MTNNEQEHNGSKHKHKLMKLRNRRIRNIIVNSLSILLVMIGAYWVINHFWRYTKYEITNNATIDQYITPVNIRVSGYIKSINFIEHQKVMAGDTLVVLDEREYRIRLIDAEAALRDAKANLELLKSTVKTSSSNIEVAKASLKEIEISIWKIGEDEKRYATLLTEKSVSLQQYQQIKADYDVAKAKHELLKEQLNSTMLQADEIVTKIKSAEAVIERRQADLEMAELNLSYTVVLAPYDGYVGKRTIGDGQLVQAGQILTNIMRDNKKWVTANYKESQISKIFVGQEVNIKIDAYKGKIFKGVVSAISEATGSKYSLIPTDNAAGNFVKVQQRIPVRIDFIDSKDEENPLLRAGMMVETEATILKF